MFLLDDLIKLARRECKIRKIDRKIISTIITIESSWRTESARYERYFTWIMDEEKFAKLHGINEATEIIFQKTSWGLMQVMGGTARDVGYNGWLPNLCDPVIGVRVGCEYFVKVCSEYVNLEDQFAAYNGGRGAIKRNSDGHYINQDYVDKAMLIYGKS